MSAEAWDDDEADTIEGVARFEQAALWGDLHEAVRRGINTDWSINCEGIALRIGALARFVGPAPWGHVPAPLVASGVYERVLREAGVEFSPTARADAARWLEEHPR
jgi:hypothetical protein